MKKREADPDQTPAQTPPTPTIRIGATFVLRDGSEYPGFVTPVPENWADVVPPPTIIGNASIQLQSLKKRFGESPLAIIAAQRPEILVRGQKFAFWAQFKDCDDLRLRLYEALGKRPEDIFPIRFEGARGLATGIASGELNGFVKTSMRLGMPTRIVVVK